MGATIPVGIMGYQGQVIKDIRVDETAGKVRIVCKRDRLRRPVDACSGRAGSVHRFRKILQLNTPDQTSFPFR